MRFLVMLFLFVGLLTGCSGPSSNDTAGTSSAPRVVYTGGGLKQLKELAGKRVREIELWDAPDMNDRLAKLLGDHYPEFKETWMIESQILAEGDILMAAGCELNNCEKNQWVLIADVANDNMNIHQIKNGQMKSYKEKNEDIQIPQNFTDEFNRMKSVQGVS